MQQIFIELNFDSYLQVEDYEVDMSKNG
ncbi:hypothetical protein C5167_038066 [Papaver somniferum]|uniref:Uncharacterized protein n=1 Tax=Papaver somniferum TaxID=3469 RepID=A0A4Y7IAR0_PAPSO|nr:hypothetical protein C5167_038066 [Papaver somniferum]